VGGNVDAFRVWADIEVRFRDTDAMGHVNNAVFLTYLEVARQTYWQRVDPGRSYDRVPFILAHAGIDFRRPVTLNDAPRVYVTVLWVGKSSFAMRYVVRARDRDVLFADAETVMVTFDYEADRSIPVPESLRRAFEAIEGRALPSKPTTAAR